MFLWSGMVQTLRVKIFSLMKALKYSMKYSLTEFWRLPLVEEKHPSNGAGTKTGTGSRTRTRTGARVRVRARARARARARTGTRSWVSVVVHLSSSCHGQCLSLHL